MDSKTELFDYEEQWVVNMGIDVWGGKGRYGDSEGGNGHYGEREGVGVTMGQRSNLAKSN